MDDNEIQSSIAQIPGADNPDLPVVGKLLFDSLLDLISFILIFLIIRSYFTDYFNNFWPYVLNMVLLGGIVTSIIYFRINNREEIYRHSKRDWKALVLVVAIIVYWVINN